MQQLTEHFCLEEFTRSATATQFGIVNEPGIDAISNLQNLCQEILEPLREYWGKPIYISSGYRCTKLNQKVGGVPTSQHLKGEAADIVLPTPRAGRDWLRWIATHCRNYDQVILERNSKGLWWLHVSSRRELHMNRHQAFEKIAKLEVL